MRWDFFKTGKTNSIGGSIKRKERTRYFAMIANGTGVAHAIDRNDLMLHHVPITKNEGSSSPM